MKPEDWQQINRLFQAALKRGQANRDAFLAQACAGDNSLRREVEALKGATVGHGGSMNWVTTGLAALGVLIGLMALLRH